MRQLLLASTVIVSLLPVVAMAQPMIQSQEGIALENQILQLQQQLQQVQGSGGSGGGSALNGGGAYQPPADQGSGGAAPDSGIVGNLLNQVQQLQAQVQQLSGQVDTLQNQVNTQHDGTEKEIGDLKFQVGGGAAAGGTAGAGGAPPGAPGAAPGTDTMQAPPGTDAGAGAGDASGGNSDGGASAGDGAGPPDVPPPPPAPVPASPHAALRAGQAALAQHDYKTAEASARSVLGSAKGSPDGYQAQFLLAQSLAGQGRPQDAAIAYDDAYNRSRAGTNAPASLLGLANSLTAIHQAAAACDTLASLNSQFPSPPAGLRPRIEAASRRAHCG